MKKVFLLFIAMIVVTACNKEDSCENWPIPEFAGTFLFISLVDSEGVNLIENGTYVASDIKVFLDGMEDQGAVVVEDTNQSGATGKVIVLHPLRKKGEQVVMLTLSATVTDTIVLNLTEFEEKDACFTYVLYKFNTVLYNGQPKTLNSEFVPRIAVVKE